MIDEPVRSAASRSPSKKIARPPSGTATTAVGTADVEQLHPLSPSHIAALTDRGLDPEIVTRLGVAASEKLGGDAVAIPYFDNGAIVGRKHRGWGEGKRFVQDVGSKQIFYNVDCLRDATLAHEAVIITEGECDAWAAMQCGFQRVVSVPGGAPLERVKDDEGKKYQFLDHALVLLKDAREIILAVDGDGQGHNLRDDLSLRLGAARCKHVQYPRPKEGFDHCKDLNDALLQYGERGVQETLKRARPMPIAGYYELDELPEPGDRPAYEIGIVGMDKHWRMRLGDLTIVTGVPGHGKSGFIDEVCGRMAEKYGWRTVFASFETEAKSDHRRALRTFHQGRLEIAMGQQQKDEADEWIRQHFGFIVPPDDVDDLDLKWFLETSAQAVLRKEAQILVLDPWNQLDHIRPPGMSMTEYVGFAIKQIHRFARKYNVHMIVAAHPAKLDRAKDGKYPMASLYDISDSAHWANRADVGIVIHRPDMANNKALIRVVKVKFSDIIGVPGEIVGLWDRVRGRYTIAEEEGL